MLVLYISLLTISLLLTLPLASKHVVFDNESSLTGSYTGLGAVSQSMRWFYYVIFTAIFAMMIATCLGRDETLPDYRMYMNLYNAGGMALGHKDMEPSFLFLTKISPTFMVMLAYYAVLSGITHIWAIIKNSPNIWIAVGAYIAFFFILHDMIQIRAAVAAGLILMAVRYQAERKWIIYFILIGIAIFFHYSAIIFVPLYFFPKHNLNKAFWGGLMFLAMVLALFDIQLGSLAKYIPLGIVESYVYNYLGNREYVGGKLGPMRIIECLILIYMIFNVDNVKERYPYSPFVLALMVCSEIAYLLLGDIPVLQTRMGELLGVVNIYYLGMIPMLSRKYYYALLMIPIGMIAYMCESSFKLLTTVAPT